RSWSSAATTIALPGTNGSPTSTPRFAGSIPNSTWKTAPRSNSSTEVIPSTARAPSSSSASTSIGRPKLRETGPGRAFAACARKRDSSRTQSHLLQFGDPLLYHLPEPFHLFGGVAGCARDAADPRRRELAQQLAHPPRVLWWNVPAEPKQTDPLHQFGKVEGIVKRWCGGYVEVDEAARGSADPFRLAIFLQV